MHSDPERANPREEGREYGRETSRQNSRALEGKHSI